MKNSQSIRSLFALPDKSMNGQESLGLTRRFEPSHLPFTLPRRLVRDLGSIVLVLVGAVDDGWHDLAVSGAVASQLVGDEPPGWPALPLQQLTKEAFSGRIHWISPIQTETRANSAA